MAYAIDNEAMAKTFGPGYIRGATQIFPPENWAYNKNVVGYAYNPTTDSWRTLPTNGAPSARYDAFGVWMGNGFLVWGGRDANGDALDGGAVYNPLNDSWSSIATANRPSDRSAPKARTGWVGWSGSKALIVGGLGTGTNLLTDGGKRFQPSPAPGTWLDLPPWPGAKDHEFGAAVWTGSELILWSGLDNGALNGAGERYKP